MQLIRPVGREAAAKKYDVLSALMALALSADPHRQRLILRFLSLVTTRYNWQRNELAMGQREIARLWCVDERTVKREMARLRADGWVEVRRQGARAMLDVQQAMQDFRDPGRPMAHGALVMIAGVLLILPGFFSDAVGLLLLLPPVQTLLARRLLKGAVTLRAGQPPDEDVIEGEFTEDPPRDGPSGWTRLD